MVVCGHKSRNGTNCPSLNNPGLCWPTPFSATVFIRFLTQGCIKDKCVQGDLLSNNSAGVLSVVTWGVLWYPARNMTSLDSRLNYLTLLFKACFTVRTKFSAKPFGDRWYGGIHLYMTKVICLHKTSYWTKLKGGLLSESNITRTPCVVNTVLNLSIVGVTGVVLTNEPLGI